MSLACALLLVLAGPSPPQEETPGWVAIAPAAWLPELAPLVAARGLALRAEAVALEDVLAASAGADAPERIKHWLWQRWRGEGLRFALLVGDADTFPVRFMVLDRVTAAAFDSAFYASDHYYADVADDDGGFDDWNACADGFHAAYFGEVNGEKHKEPPMNLDRVSYAPELAVGRWPVSDRAALRAVVAKTVAWEERMAEPTARALLIHAPDWIDARARFGGLGDLLHGAGWSLDRMFYGDAATEPDPSRVRDALLGGAELALHVGHGSDDSWHLCLGEAERVALAAAPPAIFLSIGCSTAHLCTEAPYQPYLDVAGTLHRGTNDGEVFVEPPPPPAPLQPGRHDHDGLGERLLRMPEGGAVAYLGCATGAQPCALTLLDGFTAAVAAGAAAGDGVPRVGEAWRLALVHYHAAEGLDELLPTESWYPASIYFQGMKFLLLGDPAAPLPRPHAGAAPLGG